MTPAISEQVRWTIADLEGFPENGNSYEIIESITEKDKKCECLRHGFAERETKLKLYSVQGVSEYWIADREQQVIEVYRRENGVLKKAMTLFKADCLTSPLLPGFSCEAESLFGGNNKLSNQ